MPPGLQKLRGPSDSLASGLAALHAPIGLLDGGHCAKVVTQPAAGCRMLAGWARPDGVPVVPGKFGRISLTCGNTILVMRAYGLLTGQRVLAGAA